MKSDELVLYNHQKVSLDRLGVELLVYNKHVMYSNSQQTEEEANVRLFGSDRLFEASKISSFVPTVRAAH